MAAMLGACAAAPAPDALSAALRAPAGACHTAEAMIAFDFEGAPSSACAVTGTRAFTVLITPEHAPPINPSPWYAFRYTASGDGPVSVTLRYLGGRHRYPPKLLGEAGWRELPVSPSPDGDGVVIELPPGAGLVAAQEIITAADTEAALARWSAAAGNPVITLGRSHNGRAINAVRLGRADAPRLVVVLGRQHPPEVTGAIALEAFVDALAERAAMLGDVQVLVLPLMNPDGAARGHWRANLGAVDLNRDWGAFTQPETRAVRAWLGALPAAVRPVLMLDFHSTSRNLFYVQGDEASAAQARFRSAWLDGRENALAGYPFAIEPRDANPGSGTAKNWFHARYAIPAYTYEVADTADRPATRAAARTLAEALPGALAVVAE